MSLPFTKEQLAPMMVFLDLLKRNPAPLHMPDLQFLKSFVEHFGGKIPNAEPPKQTKPSEEPAQSKAEENEPEPELESEESDLELDMTGVIEPDTDSPQKMGNPTLVPTEEEIAESQAKRSEAVSAFVEKDYEKALALYTEAIVLNPQAALLYAKRGQVYLLMGKPNACIRDCDRALELNPDSAAAHKFRGRANQLLGRFEEAVVDLRLACKFDFDEQADEWLREVTPNARKIEEHKRKKERKSIEKAARERAAAAAAAKKAAEKAKAEDASADGGDGSSVYGNFQDVLQALQDPEISAALLDISSNPENIYKYKDNPKVMALLNKAQAKFNKEGGFPGFPGMMGGMPGGIFPGAGATPNQPRNSGPKPSAPSPDDDVGLD